MFREFLTLLGLSTVAIATPIRVDKLSDAEVVYVLEDLTVSRDGSGGNVAATIEFQDVISSTGWSSLSVTTNQTQPDKLQARAAGIGEGYVTATRIYQSWNNTMEGYCAKPSRYCDKLFTYMDTNYNWMMKMIAEFGEKSVYWHQVNLILLQIEGLQVGFSMKYPGTLTLQQFHLMNMMGDLIDLEVALYQEDSDGQKQETSNDTGSHDAYEDIRKMYANEEEQILQNLLGSGHCSAMVKWTPHDLLVSHVTWNNYQAMIRVIKRYTLNYRMSGYDSEVVPGARQVFTSYPGFVFSGDDFTLISTGLVSQETTIGNFNPDLWKYVNSEGTVLEYIRGVIANRLAESGREWCTVFEKYNSGTYNNQWMVVDYNKYTAGMKTLNPGTLYVLEQLPGHIVYSDVTHILSEQTYWPSYNTPYFKSIFQLSGSQKLVDKFGPMFSYESNPRALIFKRDSENVTDVESLYDVMRYNDFSHDPLSACDSCTPPYSAINAISSRSDLNPANGTYPLPVFGKNLSGAIDYKATSSGLMRKLAMRAAAGPTWEQQPPFRWSTSDWNNVSHVGMNDLQKFDEITVCFDC